MSLSFRLCWRYWALALCLVSLQAQAEVLRVAVASNFKPAMEPLIRVFESRTGHDVSASYASTGKHHAQIFNGAPFDLLLAADARTPRLLEAAGRTVAGSRFTYAIGKLVLWSPTTGRKGSAAKTLERGEFRFLAIANPRTAPYGLAAEQALKELQLWEALQGKLVRGENVAQVFAYVSTGNAELGLLALSQVKQANGHAPGQTWLIPEALYEPIDQQAVLVSGNRAASEFAAFLKGDEAAEIIIEYGYSVP